MDSSKLDRLIERQQRRGIDIRPTLLRMLTDVYVGRQDHTPEDRAQFVGFALKLIDAVDIDTCRTVARLLQVYPAPPQAVLDKLSDRERQARVPVVAAAAAGDDPGEVSGLRFFTATAEERRSMLAALATAPHAPQSPAEAPTYTVLNLERSALAGHPGDFIRELERALRLPRETAERIVNDLGGEPMVVAARALGMPLAVLQRILMFLNPAVGHSVRRVYDLSALYEEVTPTAARRLTAAWSSAGVVDRVAAPPPRQSFEESLRAVATAQRPERRPTEQPHRRFQRTS